MAHLDDPRMIDAIWRAGDLTRAYLSQDRARVASCLTGLDADRLDRVTCWLGLDHDKLFGELGEPSLTVREIRAVAGLAPVETELAVTTALHRITTADMGFAQAMETPEQPDRVHALAIWTAVMLLEAHGPARALKHLDAQTAAYERQGYPRPRTAP